MMVGRLTMKKQDKRIAELEAEVRAHRKTGEGLAKALHRKREENARLRDIASAVQGERDMALREQARLREELLWWLRVVGDDLAKVAPTVWAKRNDRIKELEGDPE